MSKSTSVQDFQLLNSFEAVRTKLLAPEFEERLKKPLAFWALPNDRRLPLAFLGRTIGELLDTSFDELSATPGIGQKKINSLVKLLNRALHDEPAPAEVEEETNGEVVAEGDDERDEFNPDTVSDLVWNRWCQTVKRHGLAGQRLGCLAPSLKSMPTVIWKKPLGSYLNRTVSEIRSLKTHGEKRVRAVLEVFHSVHECLCDLQSNGKLAVRLGPPFIISAEAWIGRLVDPAAEFESLVREEVVDRLAIPLLDQVKNDLSDTVHELARSRLAVGADRASVRQQSQRLNVTRARVYQLLDECARMAEVRWPCGRMLLSELAHATQDIADEGAARLIDELQDLFFPEKGSRDDGED